MSKFITFMLFFLSASVISAELTLPMNVELLAVNGHKTDNQRAITLLQGTNQVVLRYSKVLRDGSDKKKYQSSPYVVLFTTNHSSDIFTVHVPRFREYSVALAAFENHTVKWIFEKNGQRLDHVDIVSLPGNKGFLPYSDIELAIKNYNNQHGIALVTSELSTESPVPSAPKKQVHPNSKVKSNKEQIQLRTSDVFVSQIKRWYLDAPSQQRKALLKWMIEQQ